MAAANSIAAAHLRVLSNSTCTRAQNDFVAALSKDARAWLSSTRYCTLYIQMSVVVSSPSMPHWYFRATP
ncbi:hypothetical protein ACVWWN_003937 [Mycobacterium sp. URHB0021]